MEDFIKFKMKFKRSIYSLIPSRFKKRFKNIYYDLLLNLYSLKHKFFYGRFDFFEVISLETTTYCNLQCSFCPNSKYERGLKKNEKLMDEKLFKKIINELNKIGYRGKVELYSYGEPLTDKRLSKLVNYTKYKLPKAYIEINSNGFLLTLKVYHKLIKNGLNRINITQYGGVMPPNTKKVLKYLKEHPNEKNIIKYRIQNTCELSNRGGEIELNKSPNYERPICGYPNSAQTIDYNGNWVLCCNDYHSSIKFGNLRKESLIEVWNKSYFKKLRRELKKKVYKLSICKKCVGLE